jgi:hypothetical protein
MRALSKFRVYLYGCHFMVETDTNILVHQLNLPTSDLLGASITRWLAWIRLFDFDVWHILGKNNSAADGLSCCPSSPHALPPSEVDDLNEIIEADIWRVSVHSVAASAAGPVLPSVLSLPSPWCDIISYLTILQHPSSISASDFSYP